MANQPVKVVGGDFTGACYIKFGVLWSGPQAAKFGGICFATPKTEYSPSDVVRVKELQQEQCKSFLGASVAAGAGAMLLGPVGLLAGALAGGNRQSTVVGVEFSDGRKVLISINPNNKPYQCMKLFAIEKNIVEHSF